MRKQSNDVVGLDIDDGFVAAAQTAGRGIGRVASMSLAPGVADDGEVQNPEALSAQIKELFREHKLGRTVRLGVGNAQIVVRHIDMPLIPNEQERDAAIRFQAAEAIAMPLEEAVLDYQPVGAYEADGGGVRQRVLVVAARRQMIDRLLVAVKGAGLKPEGIDLNAFALVRMLTDPTPSDQSGEVDHRVICHLGGVTNLAIAAGPVCVFARALSTSWLEGDEETAASLAEEVRLSIDFNMAQAQAEAVTEVLLSGPGAADPKYATALEQRTGLPVHTAKPLESVAIPIGDDPSRYTVAAGLALGGFQA